MKKKVYIVSHSHWDREWYLAYEQHHMRLIELMDDLLELFEKDPAFDSFHLDGQTIILDDYLQVRPENEAKVRAAIAAGKLRIGPFYILQDDFLISPESNVRNMLIGDKECKKWGAKVPLGYFPDTFGNMGQAPQLLRKAGIENAAFGRGVKPIGFDNQVLAADNYSSQFSEMYWEGPDQSAVFGILFANWYSNGNEIPTEKAAALEFWHKKLPEAEQYASTNNLLMMNGVDHQPVQKDVTKAIALANELFPDYEFIHSNFPDYLAQVKQDLPANLDKVEGELTSQETDGWYTLANTASARVYLKQWNIKVQRLLENSCEPLAAMAYEVTGEYPHDQLEYAWKLLMQNHPHDSICGCSVDEVHREMVTRFEKAYEVAKYIESEAKAQLAAAIDTTVFPDNSKPFVVFNTSGFVKQDLATVDVVLERQYFKDGVPDKLYTALAEKAAGTYEIIQEDGTVLPAEISKEQVRFNYDLPKDRFRIPYMERFVTVTLNTKIDAFSWQSYALQDKVTATLAPVGMVSDNGQTIESDQLIVTIHGNGTLSVTDKTNQQTVNNVLVFEDTGDIGNEYIYKQPKDDQAILSSDTTATLEVLTNTAEVAQVKITQVLTIPESADDLLDKEQKMVLEFRDRLAGRSQIMKPLKIETIVKVVKGQTRVDFTTSLDNQMKDHRLRALFPAGITVADNEADSIFEVVKRPNQVAKEWKNPTNPQHQQAFVNLHNETYGLTVSNYGLNEYEIVDGQVIALTLFRAVGELGDWGYFPTPEAQVLGKNNFNYGLELHGAPEKRYTTYKNAYTAQMPFSTTILNQQAGKIAAHGTYVTLTDSDTAITCLKRNQPTNQLVLRGYNMADAATDLGVHKAGTTMRALNLLEEVQSEVVASHVDPYEIFTIELHKE
jgi:alpha-mannosidase